MNLTYFLFFLFILLGTLSITYWAAKREKTTQQFYIVSGRLTGTQNGLAIAGDFMSAASFLGITGAIALQGFDAFFYSIGFLVSFVLLILVIAEPVRNLGTYTLADVITARFPSKWIRLVISLNTIIISILYMIPQLVAAGLIIQLLLDIPYHLSVFIVGILMIFYVVFGGMMAASWVQIIKTVLLVAGTFLITLILMSRFDWNLFTLIEQVKNTSPLSGDFFRPGSLFENPLEALSLNLTLILGTAGLPHILIRFFTVKNTIEVRKSLMTASWVIGCFYLMILILGFGAVVFVGPSYIIEEDPSGNLAAPLLALKLGGDFLMAFISAVAFATILAVVTGLVIASATSFSYDIYNHIFKQGKATERNQLMVAKVAAVIIGLTSILLSLSFQNINVTFLVSLTFVVAASTNLPVLLFTVYWKGFHRNGAIAGIVTGLVTTIALVLAGPNVMNVETGLIHSQALFPLSNPGIVAIPLGFMAAIIGSVMSKRNQNDDLAFSRVQVKAHTGLEDRG